MFCKSQLITCNRVKECNGVCPFEDALKHADEEMNEQTIADHDRDWIIGCIQHDGFIHTHRFDKANQIILDALSAEAVEVVRCKDCKNWSDWENGTGACHRSANAWNWFGVDATDYCSFAERREP